MFVPCLRAEIYPHHLRHARWLETLLCGTWRWLMRSDTLSSLSKSASTIRSRVGSPSPLKNFTKISFGTATLAGFSFGFCISIYPLIFILQFINIQIRSCQAFLNDEKQILLPIVALRPECVDA